MPIGTLAAIDKIGNMTLPCGLILTDVLMAPDFHFNLLFIAKLAKDNNCVALSQPKFCVI